MYGRILRQNSPARGLLWLALAVTWIQPSTSPQTMKNSFFKALPVHDVMFTEDVLWERTARSRAECCVRCVREAQCGTFTFRPSEETSGGSCRIHRMRQIPDGSQESMPGSRNFNLVLKDFWIQTACLTDSDCTEPHAACFSGQCLCAGGLFFDYFQNACVSTCTRNLGDAYVVYQGMDLFGHDEFSVLHYGNPAICHPICTADPKCAGFTSNSHTCYYKYITAQEYPMDWSEVIWINYTQRACT